MSGGSIRNHGNAVVNAELAHAAESGSNVRTRLVEKIEVTSSPTATPTGSIGIYGRDEALEFTVTLRDAVTVDTGSGSPVLKISVGSTGYDALYTGGQGNPKVRANLLTRFCSAALLDIAFRCRHNAAGD